MAFVADEVAVLLVNGMRFADWKTVLVCLQIEANYCYYRFTASEDAPSEKLKTDGWAGLRIRPGDHCTVILGGEVAMSGFVLTRQVAYSAQHHVVEIIGKNYTWTTTHAEAVTPTMNEEGLTFKELATKLLKPLGLKYDHQASKDPKLGLVSTFGRTVWEVLEEQARLSTIELGPIPENPGDTLQGADPDKTNDSGAVIESENILEGREVMSVEFGGGPVKIPTQITPTDDKHGPDVRALGEAAGSNFFSQFGVAGMAVPFFAPLEAAGTKEQADNRAAFENAVRQVENVRAEIVVQGWKAHNGKLWRPRWGVWVKSPMLILSEQLKCRSVTFTQDDRSGTRTLLELWRRFPSGPAS